MAKLPVTKAPVFSETMEQITSKDRAAPDTFNERYQLLLDNDNYLKKIDHQIMIMLPASEWSAKAPYTQRVAVEGIRSCDNPQLFPCTPKELDGTEIKRRRKLTGYITDGETEDGYAVFYCGERKPDEDFPVYLRGVSVNG